LWERNTGERSKGDEDTKGIKEQEKGTRKEEIK
jgi:hypothetical protein